MSIREKSDAQYGNTLIGTTTGQTGTWWRIYFITNTVFLSLTDNAGDDWDLTLASVTFPALSYIDGDFTRIALTSGSVMAYKRQV